jgi:hypothetical protein
LSLRVYFGEEAGQHPGEHETVKGSDAEPVEATE